MPGEKGQSMSSDVPSDDLTRISGIGSKIAQRLNAAGVRTYAELASLSDHDIARLLPDVTGLSPARLAGWREGAAKLAAEALPASPPRVEATPPPPATSHPAPDQPPGPAGVPERGNAKAAPGQAQELHEGEGAAPANNQHYESFLVRVLLNDDGSTRSTSVQHVSTGAVRRWPGWARDELPAFIAKAVSSPASTAPSSQTPDASAPTEAASTPAPTSLGAPHKEESRPSTAPAAPAEASAHVRALIPARLASSADLSVERAVLRSAEPFTMTVTIDFARTGVQADRLAYSAVMTAKLLPGGPKQTVAQLEGLLATASPTVSIEAPGLPPGTYRLDGALTLREPGADPSAASLAATAEGVVIHVAA